jgi:hypothetical protein
VSPGGDGLTRTAARTAAGNVAKPLIRGVTNERLKAETDGFRVGLCTSGGFWLAKKSLVDDQSLFHTSYFPIHIRFAKLISI